MQHMLPLAALAKRFGVKEGQLRAGLARDGLLRAQAPEAGDPLDAYRAQLGRISDGAVAAPAGVQVRAVAAYRKAHGIPAYDGFRRQKRKSRSGTAPWPAEPATPALAALPPSSRRSARGSRLNAFANLIGTVPDAEVARRAGVSRPAVVQYRKAWRIPAFVQPRTHANPRSRPNAGAPPPVHADADRLGAVSEDEVGKPDGVGTETSAERGTRSGSLPGATGTGDSILPLAPIPVHAPEPSRGLNATERPAPPSAVPGSVYIVTVVCGARERVFGVRGADIVAAGQRAMEALARRTDGPWRIDAIHRVAEALS